MSKKSEMITLPTSGKVFSEDTIIEALKKHCDVEEIKLGPGDVVRNDQGYPRLLTNQGAVSLTDGIYVNNYTTSQDYTQMGYKYVGHISEFITETLK